MPISRKLALTVSALLALMLLVGIMGVVRFNQLEDRFNDIADNWLPKVRAASGVAAELLDFRNRETQLLIAATGAEVDDALQRGNQNLVQLRKHEEEFAAHLDTPEEKQQYQDYQDKLSAYLKTHDQLVALVRGGKHEEALAYFRGDSRKTLRSLRPVVDDAVEGSARNARASREAAQELAATAKTWLIGCALVALVLGAGLAFWLYHAINNPLTRIQKAVKDIQERNDFTVTLAASGGDETSAVAASINQLTGALRQALGQLRDGIERQDHMAQDMAQASHQVSDSSAKQSEAAASMSATVEELTVSINQVGDNAQRAHELAVASGQAAEEGGKVISDTVTQMKAIAARITDTAQAIQALGQASQQISSIVQVIKDVADQTNLLALNAAIEAARAGEQGRGFAVVADEVRKLAERTSGATQEIGEQISGIQREVDTATDTMNHTVTLMESGVALADSAGAAVTQINDRARAVEEEVNAISDALREQGEASNQIAIHVEQIARMSEENTQGATQTADLAKELSQLASAMGQTADRFKV